MHEDRLAEIRENHRKNTIVNAGTGCGEIFPHCLGNSPVRCGTPLTDLRGNVTINKCPVCEDADREAAQGIVTVPVYQLQVWSNEQQLWTVAGEWWETLDRVAVDVLHASKQGYKCRIQEGTQKIAPPRQFNEQQYNSSISATPIS